MEELKQFQSEVRDVLERHAPKTLRGKRTDPHAHNWGGRREAFEHPGSREWLALAVERGWTAPSWPKQYGGGALDKARAAILFSEIERLELPPPLVGFGLNMIGPTLLQFGSDELKREHLPAIARGEIRWCQGYSEPNAGSDLASLQTSAIRDGDELVVNGQKVWTSYGDVADWMFLLVRTNPHAKKQAGITFLLCDLATPGVTIRPIRLISGASPFCESFFQDVRVPLRNVVGEIDSGWTVAKALLGHERGMIAAVFGSAVRSGGADRVIELAREYLGEAAPNEPILRDRIAQLMLDQLGFELTVQRSADAAKAGHRPGAESSLFKIYGTELNQRRRELLMSLFGPQALGWEGPGFELEECAQTREWLRSRGNSIEGGTSEIQLNIIAKQVLGLPD